MYLDGMVEMARITKKVKLFIVRMLAEFETPTQTSKSVKDIFNIEVSPQQCEAYDPTKRTGQDLSQELRDKFFEYRRLANEELEAIPIANKRYRLQLLQQLVEKDRASHPSPFGMGGREGRARPASWLSRRRLP